MMNIQGGHTTFQVSLLSASCDEDGNVTLQPSIGIIKIPLMWKEMKRTTGWLGEGGTKTAIYVSGALRMKPELMII